MSREQELYQQFAEEARKKKAGPQIQLCGMPWGYLKGYTTVLSLHDTSAQALGWGLCSGLCAWTGPTATQAGFPEEGRTSRLWIEAKGHPATRCVCHMGSICGPACDQGKCHDGCARN